MTELHWDRHKEIDALKADNARLRAAIDKLRPLIEEVWYQHRDASFPAEYNECDKDECMWCSETREALGAAK